jgi:hypothetical protein
MAVIMLSNAYFALEVRLCDLLELSEVDEIAD